jgi:hypothetical protein
MPVLWLSLLGCEVLLSPLRVDPPSEGGVHDTDTTIDTGPVDSTPQAGPDGYTLQLITDGTLSGVTGLSGDGFVSPSNDYTYFVSESRTSLQYLTPSYTRPEGDFCVNGSEVDGDCRGITWTSGRIGLRDVAGLCLDPDNGRLFVVKEKIGRVEVIDLLVGGSNAYTYNRPAAFLTIPEVQGASGSLSGPCVYDDHNNAILVYSSDDALLARLHLDSTDVSTQLIASAEPLGQLSAQVSQLVALGDGTFLLGDAGSAQLLHLSADGSVRNALSLDAPALDLAVLDGVAYIAMNNAGAARVDFLRESPAVVGIAIAGSVHAVAVDPSTGLALFAHTAAGQDTLSLVSGVTVIDALPMGAGSTVLDIAQPSGSGDFVVATRSGQTIRYQVFDAWPETPPALPPLDVFVFTAVEEPFDNDYFAMDCDQPIGSTASMSTRVARIEANAAVLAGLGVPVAMAVTHNFVTKLVACGDEALLDTLSGYGFELGVMVHNRPDYSCTDVPLEGTPYAGDRADYCERSTSDYCDPRTSDGCVFDGTPDPFYPETSSYCPPGDFDCYRSFMSRYIAATEQHLYGGEGGRFIVGADRHGLWDFDWVRAYKEVERPDGSVGFTNTFLAQGRAYSGEVRLNDPREKNPVPWRPADRTGVWAVGDDYTTWDLDSAFSDLVFFNGMPISTIKIHEWQLSGLHMGDYLLNKSDVGAGFQAYNEQDFEVVYQFLRNAINNRSPYSNNAWYFHIHDLSLTLNLASEDGSTFDAAQWLQALIDRIQSDFGEDSPHPDATIRWSTPAEIAARFHAERE